VAVDHHDPDMGIGELPVHGGDGNRAHPRDLTDLALFDVAPFQRLGVDPDDDGGPG
jgi:hypothetical protein